MNKEKVAYELAKMAQEACLYEAALENKPGLVTPSSNGAHKDMDFYTFINSSVTLQRPFYEMALCSKDTVDLKELKNRIKNIGILAEEDMFKATGGVNTHKGMLFLLGFGCTAAAYAVYNEKSFDEVSDIIKKMCCQIVKNELEGQKKIKTHGELVFFKYGAKGIRGEAEEGFPLIFLKSLPYFEKRASMELKERMLETLLYIMSLNDDTNILYRHSLEVLNEVKEKSGLILLEGGVTTEEGKKSLLSLCSEFKKRNISPGGSADLLAATIFFYKVKNFMS